MENQRVRLTKTMLKKTLMEMLKEKPISKITISDLCKRAEINRTTFYKYYGSQYDLLDEIEINYFEELEYCLLGNKCETYDGLTAALQFLEKEKEHWRILINTIHDEEFTNRLFNLPVIRKLLDENIGSEVEERERGYIRLFICHGCYAIIRQWLNQSLGETPEEIADLICSLAKHTM